MSLVEIRDSLQNIEEECKKELSLHHLSKALRELNFVKDRRYIGTSRVQGYWVIVRKGEPQYSDTPTNKPNEVVPEENTPVPKTTDNGEIDYGALFDLKA